MNCDKEWVGEEGLNIMFWQLVVDLGTGFLLKPLINEFDFNLVFIKFIYTTEIQVTEFDFVVPWA